MEGGINVFAYVTNNPVNFFDPFGKTKTQGIKGDDPLVRGVGPNSSQQEIEDTIKEIDKTLKVPNTSSARKKFLKAWRKVAKRGFTKAFGPPLVEDLAREVARERCLSGDSNASFYYEFLGGEIINPFEGEM